MTTTTTLTPIECRHNAQQLIERSISHSEIVMAVMTEEISNALHAESDDTVPTWGEHQGQECRLIEYRGITADGDEWRVHLLDLSTIEDGK